jgi:hypothetical protein
MWTAIGQSAGLDWMEKRPVLLAVEAMGTLMRGQMISLSATRAHIQSDDPFLLCNKVRASVRFRFADTVYALSGMAVSNEEDGSIRLDFDDVTRQDMALLRSLGVYCPDRAAFPALTPAAPVLRKRSREEQRQVLHMSPPGGVERRVEARLDLETGATFHPVDHFMDLHCTLLEISLSGCRLFAETPFNLPPIPRAEVEFVGLGHPFRLAAEVKIKEEEHLVGLRFLPMSERCRERLIDLTGELREKTPAFSC